MSSAYDEKTAIPLSGRKYDPEHEAGSPSNYLNNDAYASGTGNGDHYDDVTTLDPEAPLQGVRRVEALQSVWTKKSKWLLFIGLGLASYAYSLDGVTTWQFLGYATSTVFGNQLTGSITTASAIIIAVGKPLMAKLADVFGRAEAYVAVALLYSIGYIVLATATSVGGLGGGTVVYSFGYTGLQLLSQIIVADFTLLRWRGLASGLLSLPFIINNFIGAEVAQGILPNWRAGYWLFAALVPFCLTFIVGTMFWAQRKAKRINREKFGASYDKSETLGVVFVKNIKELDLIGLVLVATSLALILLPLSLAKTAKNGWKNPSMIAMIIVGALLFPVFLVYEAKVPRNPIVPFKFLKNTSILAACLIGFFDFFSFYLQFTNLYTFIYVTQDWDSRGLSYFSSAQSLSLTFFAILGGAIMSKTRDVKWILFVGLLVRLAGIGMMIHSRGANGSTGELVVNQVLQGLGGGFAATALQVSAQAGVAHANVATVTAMVLLITEIGNSVGSAVASAIYTNTMPQNLARFVPGNNATFNQELYANLFAARLYPKSDPIRQGVIKALDDTMFKQVLAGTIIAILPPIICFFMTKNVRLADVQNLEENKDLTGKVVDDDSIDGNHRI